ncbi:DUF397 domain-containing protein [Actinoalloteichus hymeniacidonis]|uniref:DUF397 family protein n=1 Tax=Actinoalloteichus hymeniacidonis TaxID=340345 RepID=A0AAC9HSG8_9PSEU|nr:DUF397 domain-containing protein [Actinoalloteichus hymeniacidonis]AOS64638.1 putative DUF397 family protein [Actinoalloteichus hymeniacidonis]MBB5907288.1 hypothetical protein [Actinoalloteichus hymeniacidonis]
MTLHLKGWRKSTYSGAQGGCVEVGHCADIVGIRDTKNRDGGTLIVDRAVFGALLSLVKADSLR